jgi:proline iminopeptidase
MKTFILITIMFCFGLRLQAEEKRIMTSDGVELFVNIKGSGTPVLYLHGGPGSGSYWFEKFFGEFLEQHYTMIYLDQRGVGRSSGNHDNDYSMDRMALDFEELRQKLGYESWLTLGHSFGGILQMGYYERFPNSITGMIMINCTLNIMESFCESWGPKAAEFTEKTNKPCTGNPSDVREMLWAHINNLREQNAFWKMGYRDPNNEKLIDATYGDIANWNGSFSNLAFSISDYWTNYKVNSGNVEVPVLFFYGSEDWMVGPDHYKGINFQKGLLWESKVGHMPFMENKDDLENAILVFKNNNSF